MSERDPRGQLIPRDPHAAGYDCGLNGVTEENSHYKWFTTPRETELWEAGKATGEQHRQELK